MSQLSQLDRLAQQHRPTQLNSPLATYDLRKGGTKRTKAAYIAEQQIKESEQIKDFKKWLASGARKHHAIQLLGPSGKKLHTCTIDEVHHKGNNSCDISVRFISDGQESKCYKEDNTMYSNNPIGNTRRMTVVYGDDMLPIISPLMPRETRVSVPGKLFMKDGDISVNGKYAFHMPEAMSTYIEKVGKVVGHTTDGNYIINMSGYSVALPPEWVFPLQSRIGSVVYSHGDDGYFYLTDVTNMSTVVIIANEDNETLVRDAHAIEFAALQHTKVGDTIEIDPAYMPAGKVNRITVQSIDLDDRSITTTDGDHIHWNESKFLLPAMNNLAKIELPTNGGETKEWLYNRFSYVYGAVPLHLYEWHVTRNGKRTPYPCDIYTALELAHKYGGQLEAVHIPRTEFQQRKNDFQNRRWRTNQRNPLCQ